MADSIWRTKFLKTNWIRLKFVTWGFLGSLSSNLKSVFKYCKLVNVSVRIHLCTLKSTIIFNQLRFLAVFVVKISNVSPPLRSGGERKQKAFFFIFFLFFFLILFFFIFLFFFIYFYFYSFFYYYDFKACCYRESHM